MDRTELGSKLINNVKIMKKFFIGFVAFVLVSYGVGLYVLFQGHKDALIQPVGDVNGVPFLTLDVASSTTVQTGSKQVLATSTSAQWRLFQNNSSFGIWLAFTNDKDATLNTGIYLPASTTIEFKGENLYLGAVRAVSTANATLLISQK